MRVLDAEAVDVKVRMSVLENARDSGADRNTAILSEIETYEAASKSIKAQMSSTQKTIDEYQSTVDEADAALDSINDELKKQRDEFKASIDSSFDADFQEKYPTLYNQYIDTLGELPVGGEFDADNFPWTAYVTPSVGKQS